MSCKVAWRDEDCFYVLSLDTIVSGVNTKLAPLEIKHCAEYEIIIQK